MALQAGGRLNEFESAGEMFAAVRALIVEQLAQALEARGAGLLLLSGGSTPLPLYKELAEEDLDWSRVTLALVDERWVDADHKASNERAIGEAFLRGFAASAQLVGMKTQAPSPAEGLEEVERHYAALPWPADAAILGMGADGHTASWFPHAEGLNAATDPRSESLCVAVEARESAVTGPFTQRLTLTAAPIAASRLAFLLMTGAEKKEVFARAAMPGPVEDAPVRALLGGAPDRLFCCWSP